MYAGGGGGQYAVAGLFGGGGGGGDGGGGLTPHGFPHGEHVHFISPRGDAITTPSCSSNAEHPTETIAAAMRRSTERSKETCLQFISLQC